MREEAFALGSDAAAKRAQGERRVPTIEERRKAAVELRRSFQCIERDYSEAYEQCRNDAQRRALEEARRRSHRAFARAQNEALFEDGDGWRQAESAFNAGTAALIRPLSALKTAGAVIRILKRLARIAEQLAILAA